jgi:SAM-dependent methyltransferase
VPFLDHFSERSDLYASARPVYPDELFHFVASVAPSTQRAWDCGTGNGQAAVGLARHFESVHASDPSPEQITNAIACEGVIYSIQPAESTTFADSFFDAVCVSQALHWFDLPLFFQEAKRVLRSNGVFAAWGYDWFSVSPEFDEAFDRVILQEIKQDWAPQNAILWNGYKDIDLPFAPIETPRLVIRVHWTLYQLLAYVHTWSAVRRCIARIGTGPFLDAESALASHWGLPESARAIVMPLHMLAGRSTEG